MTSIKTVVEIGCHYQNTVLDLQECQHAKVWLIDAIDDFLKLIPDSNNVHKICAAVTPAYTGKGVMSGILLPTQKQFNLPEWSTTMASLHPDHPTIKKFGWENYKSNIEVNCYSVQDVWSSFNIPTEIDFLCTDLEGSDYEVLLSIFNNKISAKILRFESKLMTNEELTMLKIVLENNGYQHFREGSKKDFAGVPFNSYAWKDECPLIELT